jgi:hypothetical protein
MCLEHVNLTDGQAENVGVVSCHVGDDVRTVSGECRSPIWEPQELGRNLVKRGIIIDKD